jgi:hypothetical protein
MFVWDLEMPPILWVCILKMLSTNLLRFVCIQLVLLCTVDNEYVYNHISEIGKNNYL